MEGFCCVKDVGGSICINEEYGITPLKTPFFVFPNSVITPPKTNMSPKNRAISKGKACPPSTIFKGTFVSFVW